MRSSLQAEHTGEENAITSRKSDTDPKGSKFAPIKLNSAKQGNKNIRLTWNRAKGASNYVIYGNQCGKKHKMKKLAVTTARRFNVRKISTELKRATFISSSWWS